MFCSICTDFLSDLNNIFTTPCGHVSHLDCLMKWIGEFGTCPVCKQPVSSSRVVKLYLNKISWREIPNNEDYFAFKPELCEKIEEINKLESQLRKAESEANAYYQEKCKLELQLHKADLDKNLFIKYQSKIAFLEKKVCVLNKKVNLQSKVYDSLKNLFIFTLESKIADLEEINKQLYFENEHLKGVKTIVNGTQLEAEKMLSSYSSNAGEENAAKKLASYCSILKCHLDGIGCLLEEEKNYSGYGFCLK